MLPPFHASGWPAQHLETVPHCQQVQPGVVAKGSFPFGQFTTARLPSQASAGSSINGIIDSVRRALGLALTMNRVRDDGAAELVCAMAVGPKLWSQLTDAVPSLRPLPAFEFKQKHAKETGEVTFPQTPAAI